MPAIPEVENSALVVVTYEGNGPNPMVNRFYCLASQAYSTADLTALADAFSAQWAETSLTLHLTRGLHVTAITATDLSGQGGSQDAPPPLAQGEANTDVPLPPNCAICVSWRIPARYRGGHPRTYIPGIIEGDLEAPGSYQLGAGVMADFTTWGNGLIDAVQNTPVGTGGAWTLGCVSRVRDKVELNPPVFYPYISAYVDNRLDSQRRRLGR